MHYCICGSPTGIYIIKSLRNEFNADIPALLLTGDTAPDRMHIVGDSCVTVLRKPLHEEELGEMLSLRIKA